MKLTKIIKSPINYIGDIFDLLLNNSMSNLQIKIREIKSKNYDKNGQIDIEKSLIMINSFYTNDLEEYCSQNGFNVIRELELRKDELEQDMNYIINIIICIFTSVLSTGIVNYYIFWFAIIKKSTSNMLYSAISSMVGILAAVIAILFFPLIKWIINRFRKEKMAELDFLNQYELKIINEILNKKVVDMLNITLF